MNNPRNPNSKQRNCHFTTPALREREHQLADRVAQPALQPLPKNRRASGKGLTRQQRAQRVELRIEYATSLLLKGATVRHVVRQIRLNEGVSKPVAYKAVYRARARMLDNLREDREQLVSHSLYFYAAMSMDASIAPRDRIRARERLDTLLGLDAPKRVQAEVDTTLLGQDALIEIMRAHFPEMICEQSLADAEADEDDDEQVRKGIETEVL